MPRIDTGQDGSVDGGGPKGAAIRIAPSTDGPARRFPSGLQTYRNSAVPLVTVAGSMPLFRFLYRYSPNLVIWTSVAALLSGACNMGLIAMIHNAVKHIAERDTAIAVASATA